MACGLPVDIRFGVVKEMFSSEREHVNISIISRATVSGSSLTPRRQSTLRGKGSRSQSR